jgi:hypothetical protein
VRKKYAKSSPICLIPFRMSDSPLWKDLMKVRYIYLRGMRYIIGNGKSVSFWLDVWLGEKPLCLSYPCQYDLCSKQKCSILTPHVSNLQCLRDPKSSIDFKIRI